MTYAALLRGINVGGNNRVEMSRLKNVFEKLGFEHVRTYINSGNILFDSPAESSPQMIQTIEKAIKTEFGLDVPVVVRSEKQLRTLEKSIPTEWVNDVTMKTDVMFLWKSHDKQEIMNELTIKPDIDEVAYFPGAIVWRVDRKNVTRSGLLKIVGTDLYKNMTIRNINTLRKLVSMLG